MNRRTVVTVCSDPGAARAMVPVIHQLLMDKAVSVLNYSYNQATDILHSEHIPYSTIHQDLTSATISAILSENEASLLLTGTSQNGLDWEKLFTRTARVMHIPTLAILDFWSNYVSRFSTVHATFDCLADFIAVMDERARTDMLAVGIPAERILVTGQPAFEHLAERLARFNSQCRARVRESLGTNTSDLLVIFASQPIRRLYGDKESPNFLGYTEDSVLKHLVWCLEEIQVTRAQDIVLLIRPHPREEVFEYARYGSSIIRIVTSADKDRHDCVMAADLVTGMTSVLLVEACYLQCPVISLQPGLRTPDTLPSNAWRVSTPVYEYESMSTTIQAFLDSPNRFRSNFRPTAGLKVNPGGTRRILDCVYALAARQRPLAPNKRPIINHV